MYFFWDVLLWLVMFLCSITVACCLSGVLTSAVQITGRGPTSWLRGWTRAPSPTLRWYATGSWHIVQVHMSDLHSLIVSRILESVLVKNHATTDMVYVLFVISYLYYIIIYLYLCFFLCWFVCLFLIAHVLRHDVSQLIWFMIHAHQQIETESDIG